MASLRQIRGRIKSIQSSKQIMRAMQLVSGSKLKRSQDKLIASREVLGFLDGLLQRVLAATASEYKTTKSTYLAKKKGPKPLTHPLSTPKPDGPSALVIITSDAGLCGSYNTNLVQMAEAYLRRDAARRAQLVFIGKRAHRYFTKRGYATLDAFLDLAGRPNVAKAEQIGRSLIDRFLSGEVSSVSVLYSRFLSATTYKPTVQPWLPIQLDSSTAPQLVSRDSSPTSRRADEPPSAVSDYIFEPSPEQVYEDLLPRWALAKFQLIMLEAFTSEHSARMIAMKNATDNAEELLGELVQQRNRIRQATITKELSEIVGTAEALK